MKCPVLIPPVIAHRGASHVAPENTLAAFRRAKSSGAGWVELDVMLAGTGEAVVIHDDTLERTTSGSGRVRECSWSVLSTLDAGSWFGASFAGERIPLLSEVLALCHRLGLGVDIEIKAPPGDEGETVMEVLGVLSKSPMASINAPVMVSSFSEETLALVRRHSIALPIGLAIHGWTKDWRSKLDFLNACSLHVNREDVSPERVRAVHQAGFGLLVYTVNSPEEGAVLFDLGVSAIFSDCPEQLIALC